LRHWYLQNIILSVFIAAVLLVALFVSGVWAVWEVLNLGTYDVLFKGLFSVLWFVVMLVLSVILGTQISSLMLQLFYRENALAKILTQENRLVDALSNPILEKKSKSFYLKEELKGTLLGILVTLLFWPFLLFIPLMPIGVTVFSFALGFETFASAERVLNEKGLLTYSDGGSRTPKSFLLGLGLLASEYLTEQP
jgi:hypothetical protein